MSASARSPKMRTSGLPKMKWRHRWSASAKANALPSMAAYRDSAACVNRDPTRVMRQPSLQQKSSRWGQEQCFWNIQNPMPDLLQSVAMHVVLSRSNISTPVWIWSMMTALDASNAVWCMSVHTKVMAGFSSSQNGVITSASEKV